MYKAKISHINKTNDAYLEKVKKDFDRDLTENLKGVLEDLQLKADGLDELKDKHQDQIMNYIFKVVNEKLEDLELDADKVREEKVELENKLSALKSQLTCCQKDNEKRILDLRNKGKVSEA